MKNPIPISRDSFSGGTLLSDNWWAIVFQAIVFQWSLNFADILLKKNFQPQSGSRFFLFETYPYIWYQERQAYLSNKLF